MMIAKPRSCLFFDLLIYTKKIGDNLLKITQMLLHALFFDYLQLIELLLKKECIGKELCHIQFVEFRLYCHRRSLAQYMIYHVIR